MIYKWIVVYWNQYNNHKAIKVETDAYNLMQILLNNGIVLDNILSITKEIEINDRTYSQPPLDPYGVTITTTDNTDPAQ